MESVEEFYTKAEEYLNLLKEFVEKNAIEHIVKADHIGYKCASKEMYEKHRALFETESSYILQSMLSQRRVSIIRLHTPLSTVIGNIYYLELSDQKPDGSQTDGFDHVEIYPHDFSYEELVTLLETKGNLVEKVTRPHHSTHNISLRSDFKLKVESGPLIKKIQREELD